MEYDRPGTTAQAAAPRRVRNIAELAKIAGVSAGTVSRALAGKDLVNAETRERIQALAREHGFRPNQMARRLRTQRTGVIGVVIPLGHERRQHISDPFFMYLLGLLADELTEGGYDLMLSRVVPGDAEWLDRFVDSGMLDGAIVIGQSDQFAVIERVAERYLPMVVWGVRSPGQKHCSVGSDNIEGGRLAARRLIEQGCRRIAFFGDPNAIEIAHRYEGVQRAVAEAGPDCSVIDLPTHLSSDEMDAQIASYLDGPAREVDGIVAASDTIAVSTVRLLLERGIAVPGDVRVIGFDDLPLASQTVPQLTTIHQDIARGAKIMVDSLMRRIAGDHVASTVMDPELVVRASG
ncbi:MAG: LacI family DNA-binding transcriptional regulator [Sphingomonadales bacterium]|nr:LacI family DNA-binding transcriptional regulator [Sphingomonadales bacterium]MDE2569132.1 LacI family DNA-binding transcriptional regulator [Sphingomonadales bacterium]